MIYVNVGQDFFTSHHDGLNIAKDIKWHRNRIQLLYLFMA